MEMLNNIQLKPSGICFSSQGGSSAVLLLLMLATRVIISGQIMLASNV